MQSNTKFITTLNVHQFLNLYRVRIEKEKNYNDTGELELPFQIRYTKMLLMCIESKIDTDEVWEALKDMYPFDTDLIDDVQCHKASIQDLKKLWSIL